MIVPPYVHLDEINDAPCPVEWCPVHGTVPRGAPCLSRCLAISQFWPANYAIAADRGGAT